ncbi:hypothetical protein NAT51_13975 [Flavobacterium amniphilum]|uniref:hypothetical protein n=1 Tax=Flavobacterium amniphilum TaxID=1834035 RepID=UPI00202AC097|nr:hypothetical protein [Flavobacterium amniphilum]MCL9806639.1 hypothetical protein [Flavobacterium amniphilum]
MKSTFTITLLLVSLFSAIGQNKLDKLKDQAVKEGLLLYQSEKASWHGTDLFLEKFTEREKLGGYISYTDGDNPKCVFISKQDRTTAIGTITFDKTFDLKTATTDLTERKLTPTEKEYFDLRIKASERISSDTIFAYYKNTGFNIVPLISGNEKKVYVLTGSKENGKFIIGNDYLIEFDKKSNVKKVKKLHKGLLVFEYGNTEEIIVSGIHTHLPEYDDVITPTDICTIMLYQDLAGWGTHLVTSEKYVSIWDCKKNELVVLTKEAWEKINKEQK